MDLSNFSPLNEKETLLTKIGIFCMDSVETPYKSKRNAGINTGQTKTEL